jgi:TonB family protein
MLHGTQEFFLERARCSRRTSLTSVAVGFTLGLLLLAAQVPAIRHALLRNPMRFGYEGPEQFVRRVLLATEPVAPLTTQNGITYRERTALHGGRTETHRTRVPHAVPETRPLRIGPGESEADLLMRARHLHRDAQVFRSEDLVVEKFVNPDYPEEAREKGLEGPVVLLARVDVEGKVAGVEVMSSTGDRPLERAAAAAVWQCRFRPYELDGQVQEVYAVFRFRFQLY